LNDETFEDNPVWETNHRTFHRNLIGNCGAPQLIQFCDLLVNKLFRYRRLSIQKVFTKRKFEDEHKQLVDLVIAKKSEEACNLLDQHFRLTAVPILEDANAFEFD
jgi:DNA-binding GntR family transcriptional regulator